MGGAISAVLAAYITNMYMRLENKTYMQSIGIRNLANQIVGIRHLFGIVGNVLRQLGRHACKVRQ